MVRKGLKAQPRTPPRKIAAAFFLKEKNLDFVFSGVFCLFLEKVSEKIRGEREERKRYTIFWAFLFVEIAGWSCIYGAAFGGVFFFKNKKRKRK